MNKHSKSIKCKYVKGPTASNKTGGMIAEAARIFNKGGKALLVGPSISALEEYQSRGHSSHPGITFEAYHSKKLTSDSSGSVLVDVERVLDNRCVIGGRIACITHATFQKLNPSKQWPEWDVFIDEALDVYQPAEKNLHYSHRVITEGLEAVSSGPFYSSLKVTDGSRIRSIAEDRNDDSLRKELKEVAERLLNENYNSYTIKDAYQKLLKSKGKRNKFYAYSVFTPRTIQRFKSVTVLSARFDESLHFHIWQREGVEWAEDKVLTGKLKFQTHQGYDNLTIHYGYERNFSKSFRDKNPESYAAFIHRAIGAMNGKKFIRLENNDIKFTSVLSKSSGGETIEGRSNGLNCYRHFDNAIIIPALNYSSQASDFLERQYGINDEMQSIGFACNSIYQASSRTSMRDGDLSIERNWVVPTKRQAQWLSGVMGGSSIVSLGLNDQPEAGTSGRPKKYANGNARKAKGNQDKRNRERQASEFEDRIAGNVFQDVPFFNANHDVVNTIIHKGDIVALFRSSLFTNQWDKEPCGLVMKPSEFVRFLKMQAKIEYGEKHEVPLISPAFFNPTIVPETRRGEKNTMFASGIMLDLDNTDIKPNQFADIFHELKMVTYNTFSNQPGDLRYRVYIDTTRPMTADEYKSIVNAMITRIEDQGYIARSRESAKPRGSVNVRYHGVDLTKRGPYSLFHLPCQSKDDSKGSSFIKEFTGPDRSPLDVNAWVLNLPYIENEEDRVSRSYPSPIIHAATLMPVQKAGIDDALDEWYRAGTLPGNGCEGIRVLYSKLYRLRIPTEVRHAHLYHAANSANSPGDRKRQVDGLIKSERTHLSSEN